MSRRQERRVDEIELGWVIEVKLGKGKTQKYRVDKIRTKDLPRGLIELSGPRYYVGGPDTLFLRSGRAARDVLIGSEPVVRILPKGHPDAG